MTVLTGGMSRRSPSSPGFQVIVPKVCMWALTVIFWLRSSLNGVSLFQNRQSPHTNLWDNHLKAWCELARILVLVFVSAISDSRKGTSPINVYDMISKWFFVCHGLALCLRSDSNTNVQTAAQPKDYRQSPHTNLWDNHLKAWCELARILVSMCTI
jgi:hypothetical protein